MIAVVIEDYALCHELAGSGIVQITIMIDDNSFLIVNEYLDSDHLSFADDIKKTIIDYRQHLMFEKRVAKGTWQRFAA